MNMEEVVLYNACYDKGSTFESYYGSPPNFSLTKSPVSKPAPGLVSPEVRWPLSPRHHRSIVLCNRLMYDDVFS